MRIFKLNTEASSQRDESGIRQHSCTYFCVAGSSSQGANYSICEEVSAKCSTHASLPPVYTCPISHRSLSVTKQMLLLLKSDPEAMQPIFLQAFLWAMGIHLDFSSSLRLSNIRKMRQMQLPICLFDYSSPCITLLLIESKKSAIWKCSKGAFD